MLSGVNWFRITPGEEEMHLVDKIPRLFGKSEPDCVEVRKLSSEYLEGNLKPSRLKKIRAHLSSCGPCQAFVDSLASMIGMLTNLPKADYPPTLQQSIVGRIKEERAKRGDFR